MDGENRRAHEQNLERNIYIEEGEGEKRNLLLKHEKRSMLKNNHSTLEER